MVKSSKESAKLSPTTATSRDASKKSISEEQGHPQKDFSLLESLEVDLDPNADVHLRMGTKEDNGPKTCSSGGPKSKVAEPTESEESSEDEGVCVARMKPLTKIAVPSIRSRAADRLAAARISINRMNLLRSPIPLRFGEWNDRALVERYAKGLQNSFQTQGVRPFEMENMIPLVIHKDHLDSKCLNFKGLNAAEAPFLQLISKGLKEPSIKVAGGRHRFRAVELENERLSTEIKRLEGKIQDDNTATEEEKDMNRAYKATIDTLSKERERVCTWGVIIYDEGKQCRLPSYKSEIGLLRATLGRGRDARNRAIAEREEAPVHRK